MLLPLTDEEAEYLGDVLQMWSEGVEAEVPGLTTTAEPDVHWTRFQLRKQLIASQTLKLRIDTLRQEERG